MDIKELQRLVKFARKQGILRIKTADVEIELAQSAISPTKITRTPKSEQPQETLPQYSQEDILYWSTQPLDPTGSN